MECACPSEVSSTEHLAADPEGERTTTCGDVLEARSMEPVTSGMVASGFATSVLDDDELVVGVSVVTFVIVTPHPPSSLPSPAFWDF